MVSPYTPPSPLLCGCYIVQDKKKQYLPQVKLSAHATIRSSASQTTLTQVFSNPHKDEALKQVCYIFPLFDGVSVVGFTCTIGPRTIKGVVKERQVAKQEFEEARDQGKTTALLEQLPQASDAFTATLGNVPAGESVKVDVTYLGELKHDAEVDGLRFTIPTVIAPRYGDMRLPGGAATAAQSEHSTTADAISVTVDAEMPDGSAIRSIESPSHPVSVSIGSLSTSSSTAEPSLKLASATLTRGSAELDKDFIVQIVAANLGTPTAVLETHATIPDQRALMVTLVPKFKLPAEKPEIVFVCDRSGSMRTKMPDLVAALQLFLRSLPVGAKFNICSFGNRATFLWPQSQTYNQSTLDEATKHVSQFEANYGGTNMYEPVHETFQRRFGDINLEAILLTDGQIWDQQELFGLINEEVTKSKGAVRVFSIGLGESASHALIEGVARAGNGCAQSIGEKEKMEKKIIRTLKAAMTPHVKDYTLEIKYDTEQSEDKEAELEGDEGFEIVEKMTEDQAPERDGEIESDKTEEKPEVADQAADKKPISLFDPDLKDDGTEKLEASKEQDTLPEVPTPRYLQAPTSIPPLFPFNRTTVYVLLSDSTPHRQPKSITLRGTSKHGPLELEVPVTVLKDRGTAIHQLAARKAVRELEDGRGGWVGHARTSDGTLVKDGYPSRLDDLVEREGVRLGLRYQIAGKWCSFLAVDHGEDGEAARVMDADGDRRDHELAEPDRVLPFIPYDSMRVQSTSLGSSIPHQRGAFGSSPLKKKKGNTTGFACKVASPRRSSREQPMPAPPPPPAGPATHGLAMPAAAATLTTSAMAAPAAPRQPDANARMALATSMSCMMRAPPAPPGPVPDAPSGEAPPADPPLLGRLAAMQWFDGHWQWTEGLEKLLGLDASRVKVEEVESKLEDGGGADNKRDVLATVCAIVFLKKTMAEDEEAWEMLVMKAEAWLEMNTNTQGSVGELERVVDGLF